MFRGLKADEIEVRIGTIGNGKVNLLLYKDARCDMNVLDETYGAEGWQRDHKEIKGNLYAGVGIYSEKLKDWIWKWDCGTESNTEKEKGEASDSFKRACFNLGIGRELYTGGLISVKCETEKNDRGKYELKDKWAFFGAKVTEVQYEETETKRTIIGITIADNKDKVLYMRTAKETKSKKEAENIGKEKVKKTNVDALKMRMASKNVDEKVILKYYQIDNLSDLTLKQWQDAMERVEK